MKESIQVAEMLVRSRANALGLKSDIFESVGVHIHVPEGATPKDGPSAGITMATSLISLALEKSVPSTVAMTGELTLTGKVLRIGGLKEKTIAAKRSGVATIFFPEANLPDWEELPENIKDGLEGISISWYEELLRHLKFLV